MTPTHPRAVDALKPCPFCGGPARDDIYIRDGRKVECMSCSASTIAFSPDANTKAIAAWNQRPQPDHGSVSRKDAEKSYACSAFDFENNPIGSREWSLFWKGWCECQAALAQPGDGGEFVEKLKDKNLDDDLISIFGTLCFQAIPYAQRLRAEGHEIKNKSVDEQAAVIAWKLRFYLEHGEAWRVKISEYIERHIALSRKSEA